MGKYMCAKTIASCFIKRRLNLAIVLFMDILGIRWDSKGNQKGEGKRKFFAKFTLFVTYIKTLEALYISKNY